MARHVSAPPGQERRIPMSYEEYLAWEDEGRHGEWVDGEVIVFMVPTILHQLIAGFLYSLLSLYARRFDLGLVLIAPVEMHLRPDGPSREPDVLFIAREHLDRLSLQRLAGPADLVIEIVSDESQYRDRVDKFFEYQEAGVREYWLLDPRPGKRRTDFFRLTPEGQYQAALPDTDGRYHAAVLPGFWLRPAWLWQDPLPDVEGTLATIVSQPPATEPEQRSAEGAAGNGDPASAN